MTLWLITPSSGPDDTRWLDFPIWTEVTVRASSPARARLLAARMEAEMTADDTPVGNEAPGFRSAFEDEKLYWVRRLSPGDVEAGEHAAEGPERVLSATLGSAPHPA